MLQPSSAPIGQVFGNLLNGARMTSGRAIRIFKSFIRHPIDAFRTYVMRAPIAEGASRWAKSESLNESWDARTREMSTHIPADSSIIEFGAGRQTLRRFLPSGCTYVPSDLVPRSSDTLICDLNSQLPRLDGVYDVALFSGVLEYVRDTRRLATFLSEHFRIVIASYATNERCPDELTRRLNGWINDFSTDEFVEIFTHSGFVMEKSEHWTDQKIFVFRKIETAKENGFRSESQDVRI